MSQKVLLTSKEINIILHRLACQLMENHLDFKDTALIGIQPRGGFLAERLVKILKKEYKIKHIDLGFLDITFFRDDFGRGEILKANSTQMNFLVEDKKVVFIDDVLLTLIDRRFSRHLPIQPTYRGRQVDAINDEKVKVMWEENDGEDKVYLISK